MSFLGGSVGKESICNARNTGSIPGLGRSNGGGNGNPLQYSCLENPMDKGAWQATVHGVTYMDITSMVTGFSGVAHKVKNSPAILPWRLRQ